VLNHEIRVLPGAARLKIQPLARDVALLRALRHVPDVPEQRQVTLLSPRERNLKGRVDGDRALPAASQLWTQQEHAIKEQYGMRLCNARGALDCCVGAKVEDRCTILA
jgi:hypothetical protein